MGEFNYAVIGRLKDGVTPGQAVSELNVLQVGLVRAAGEKVDLKALVIPLLDAVVGRARRGLLLLLGAIVGVLLIACANLANLSLTRTVGRLREAAIRTALGASRSRLIWRVVIEQLALAVAGGGVGVIIAQGALAVFVRTAPIDLPRVDDIALDGRVLVFAAVVTLVAGLTVALLPAARVAGRDVQQALRAGGLATTGDRGGRRTRASLLAGQVALSVTLLVVTALLVVSLARLLQVNPGFDARGVLDVQVALPAHRYGAVLPRLAASTK
jgi:putative ABC transport system permease protein